MKRVTFLMIILTAFILVSCSKKGEQKSSSVTLAKVGSATITQDDVNREMKALPDQIQGIFKDPEGTGRFVDELVKKEILYQEAKKRGMEKGPEYLKKLEDFKKITIIGTLLEKEIEDKAKVSDKDVKDYYDSHKSEFVANNSVRASHILVKTEEEAKKISEQIKKGGDFAKLAREKSIDTGSARNGGDLGTFSRGQMVPEFEKVAFSLKVKEVSGPVKSQFGYHIIKVTERKEGTPVEFDKVKNMLTQRLTAQKQKEVFDSYMDGLRKSYKVEINKDAIAKISGADKGKTELQPDKPGQTPKPEEKKQ